MKLFPDSALAPTCLTLGNLACGFSATLAAAGFETAVGAGPQVAGWLIVAAMTLDGLDGAIARRFGATSQFGVQLDSLADVVSFGVAPAALVVSAFELPSSFAKLAALVYLSGAALRLARFTSEPPTAFFAGLPSPAAAAVIVVALMIKLPAWAVCCLAILLAGLMVSRLRFPHPGQSFSKVFRHR